jgi:DNA-binding NtrC family response regulator
MKAQTILIVDDNRDLLDFFSMCLGDRYHVDALASPLAALEKLKSDRPDLILLDVMMPDMDGISFLQELRHRSNPTIPTIVMSANDDLDNVVRAMKLGALDFFRKPIAPEKLNDEVDRFFAKASKTPRKIFGSKIMGNSRQMRQVWDLIEKFAPSDINILLLGESGTGKELFARVIHEMSKRSQGPFVAVDCTALPESLVESELFGHEKGAFTGATANKTGWLETANDGTLFLDEIGNLSSMVQAKLLRTLQESTIAPVGSRRHKQIDVRLVSATNVDLEKAAAEGGFRADLYYRISTVPIRIPPLREREGDIPLLVDYFIERYNERYGKNITGINPRALEVLCRHPWPGNVRELENAIKSAILLSHQEIVPQSLGTYLLRSVQAPAGTATPAQTKDGKRDEPLEIASDGKVDLKKIRQQAAEEAERAVIEKMMKQSPLTQSKLAALLGLDRKTLRAKLQKLGLGTSKKDG